MKNHFRLIVMTIVMMVGFSLNVNAQLCSEISCSSPEQDTWLKRNQFYIAASAIGNFSYWALDDTGDLLLSPDFGGIMTIGYVPGRSNWRLELDFGVVQHIEQGTDMRVMAKAIYPFKIGSAGFVGPIIEGGTAFSVQPPSPSQKYAYGIFGFGLTVGAHVHRHVMVSLNVKGDLCVPNIRDPNKILASMVAVGSDVSVAFLL